MSNDEIFYNQENKVRCLEFCRVNHPQIASRMRSLFFKTKNAECDIGKDMADFDEAERSALINSVALSEKEIDNIAFLYNTYLCCCDALGISRTAQSVAYLTRTDSVTVVNGKIYVRRTSRIDPSRKLNEVAERPDLFTVANPQELKRILDSAFCKDGLQKLYCIYKAVYWLSFLGLRVDEIGKLTNDDVDFKNKTVKCGEYSFRLYPESVECIKECVNNDELYMDFKNYEVLKRRSDGQCIIRGLSKDWTVEEIAKFAMRRYRERGKELGITKKITLEKLRKNGVMYAASLEEKSGKDIDWDGIVLRDMRKKSLGEAGVNSFANAKRRLKKEYKIYKSAVLKQ